MLAAKASAKPVLNGRSKSAGKKADEGKVGAKKTPAKAMAKKSKSQAAKKSAPKSAAKKSRPKSVVQQSLPFWSELLNNTVGGIPAVFPENTGQPAEPLNLQSDNTTSPEPESTMSAATLTPKKSIHELAINTIRTLSMDGVQAANSGHPGTPMALAPIAYTIWQNEMRYDPADPIWPARDRFV